MELLQELFVDFLKSGHFKICFEQDFDWESIVEKECYKVLRRIKEIIKDETLADPECFARIEEIVCLLESTGTDCGARHDF